MKGKVIERDATGASMLAQELPPLLARIYAARGIQYTADIQYQLDRLYADQSLLGLDQAVEGLVTALERQHAILILGDFDADGATSSALAVNALKLMGHEHVSYLVPNRFEDGYGLTPEIVEVAQQQKPDWIITVDNGIGSNEGVAKANAYGINVIITDHHLPGQTVPPAYAIVNPNQPGDAFPSKHLAGVGVVFYVMLALRRRLRHLGWFANRPEPNMAQLLDLVALGTVADVVPLDGNNRILVQQGLKRIRAQKTRPGIQALIESAKRDQAWLTAADLGFGLGPRLNAAGRLEDMSYGIECLLATDLNQAKTMAQRLDSLNRERRQIEDDMKNQAESALAQLERVSEMPTGICLYEPDWHQGVIGLVASRVKERWHRPVIAFAADSDTALKGSARSIPGVHIRDTLDAVSKKYPHLLNKFGGHAMAAGLNINREQLPAFKQAFDEEVAQRVTAADLHRYIYTDGELEAHDMTLENAELLRDAGPWGQGFPEPVFHGCFEVVDQRLVGMYHLKLVLSHENQQFSAIAFNVDVEQWPNYRCREVHAVYQLDVNIYQNRKQLQLLIQQIEPIC